jgi:molybdopterin converting factor small subunit
LGVKIVVPYHLLQLVDNNGVVEVQGATVKESLLNLGWKYPAMMPELFDANGNMGVIVLHEGAPIEDSKANTPVKDDDTIAMFPIIEGG